MKEIDFTTTEELKLGDEIRYKFGLLVDEEQQTYEFIDYGKFIVYKKEYNEDTKDYSYTCYDFMLKTMVILNSVEYKIDEYDPQFPIPILQNTCDYLLKKTCKIHSLIYEYPLI